jgi:hypothetical protein
MYMVVKSQLMGDGLHVEAVVGAEVPAFMCRVASQHFEGIQTVHMHGSQGNTVDAQAVVHPCDQC